MNNIDIIIASVGTVISISNLVLTAILLRRVQKSGNKGESKAITVADGIVFCPKCTKPFDSKLQVCPQCGGKLPIR